MATEVIEDKTTQTTPDLHRSVKTTAVRDDVQTQRVQRKQVEVFKAYQVVWYILAIIEILLAFRFLLELFGANAYSGFANFIYTISYPFVYPFENVFGISSAGRVTVEWPIFLAAIVYAVIAYIISRFLQILNPVSPQDVDVTV